MRVSVLYRETRVPDRHKTKNCVSSPIERERNAYGTIERETSLPPEEAFNSSLTFRRQIIFQFN